MKTSTAVLLLLCIALVPGLRAASAADNWADNCASCHGEDGKAQTKQGKKLKIRDYTDAAVQAELKDEEMIKAITEGVKEDGKKRMDGFGADLSAQEIKDLVAHIRSLKG